ncbi:hypothetical protein BGX23_005665 [Mortierella sp. AD031]|nr:hypothetical protein BGX23_005665 [Mortierella sp. AD031]
MPATPKAAVLGNGQKVATATSAASPAASLAKPSPSSAGMSTSVNTPTTPLSKNQKKKRSKAAKTAATNAAAAVPATTTTTPSTPVANVKQQEASSSTKQITSTVESLGLTEEKKSHVEQSPIARNILDAAPVIAQPKRVFFAHTFQWKNGGSVVKVTGTFDNWAESIVLKKVPGNQDQSEIIVDLDRSQKTLFKFIVDGEWKCTDEYSTEYDSIGNLNNVLPALNA